MMAVVSFLYCISVFYSFSSAVKVRQEAVNWWLIIRNLDTLQIVSKQMESVNGVDIKTPRVSELSL